MGTSIIPSAPAWVLAGWSNSLVMSAVWLAGGGLTWTGAQKLVKVMVAVTVPALRAPEVPGAGTGAWKLTCRTRWWGPIHTSTGNMAVPRALISWRIA